MLSALIKNRLKGLEFGASSSNGGGEITGGSAAVGGIGEPGKSGSTLGGVIFSNRL
jgi:hypothetical protein